MDMACQKDVSRFYSHTLSMDSTQVGIIKETHLVVFSNLLQCLDSMNLKVQVMFPMLLCYLMHQTQKRLLVDEELGTPLILAYLTDSHHPMLVLLWPLSPPFLNSLQRSFPPTVGLMQPALPQTLMVWSHLSHHPNQLSCG